MKAAPLCIFGILAACQSDPPSTHKHLLNLEVTGSAECLGEVVSALLDTDVGLAHEPVWSNGIGRMEVGPIDRSKLQAVTAKISERGCAKDVRIRPCSTPNSDLEICGSDNSGRSVTRQTQ